MRIPSVIAIVCGSAAIAACNSEPEMGDAEQATVEAPQPVMTPAAVASAAPDGTALVAGEWTVNEDATGVRAQYAVEGMQPSLIVTCDPAYNSVSISMASSAGAAEAWRLDAGGEAARIDMLPSGGVLPELTAQVDHGLAIIRALGDQGQVFMLTSPQRQSFQFPTHPGIRRVLDRCTPQPAPAATIEPVEDAGIS
ncbi:hypothetical protein [Aurantiacibacter sp. D1-12]|uniref:hypothetical protein n=1 Tax=Aurantiacibacter sp. D1-12 TaxID=2993658 RepID=UPI00237C8B27|nr:hypothetical protein [Aurantiacibacter sp. D1-12]MDE1467948.1 hypothetical protein [Aurantiacibacter sp. D1-12]